MLEVIFIWAERMMKIATITLVKYSVLKQGLDICLKRYLTFCSQFKIIIVVLTFGIRVDRNNIYSLEKSIKQVALRVVDSDKMTFDN